MGLKAHFVYNKFMKYILAIIVIYAAIIMIMSYDFNASDADYLIVFGSGLDNDRETFTMVNRVDRAALYYKRNRNCKIIVSGGVTGNNSVSEASVMRRLLIERNVPVEMITMEENSINTKQNVANCIKLVDKDSKIVVCSNDYHILRIKLLFLKHGYKVHSIFCRSMPVELFVHLPLEEIFIIKNLIDKD